MRTGFYLTSSTFMMLLISTVIAAEEFRLLDIDFDDRSHGTILGDGGAEMGEPIRIDPQMEAEVLTLVFGQNLLNISYNGSNSSATVVHWGLLDNAEINHGIVRYSLQFTPVSLDRYQIGVRESQTTTEKFLTLSFSESGEISAEDNLGGIDIIHDSYESGETQHIVMTFDMSAGTSEAYINGNKLFSGRKHGITEKGVGGFFTGFSFGSNHTPFYVDELLVEHYLIRVLDADFEDKTANQPLSTGGAIVGEPVFIANAIDQVVKELAPDRKLLMLDSLDVIQNNSMWWGFLSNLEINSETLVIEADLTFNIFDSYHFLIRDSIIGDSNFASIFFSDEGKITITDKNGMPSLSATYEKNKPYRLSLVFNFSNKTYSFYLNDEVLVEDRLHGVGSGVGIGAVIFGFEPDASNNASFMVDNIDVFATDVSLDVIFKDAFE